MNSNVVMIKGSQVDLWGRALKVELARWHYSGPALAQRVVRCRVMIWISMGTASVFSVLNKIPRPRPHFRNHYLPCSRENAASQTRFLRGENPKKSFHSIVKRRPFSGLSPGRMAVYHMNAWLVPILEEYLLRSGI